jgi:hypothetical protein
VTGHPAGPPTGREPLGEPWEIPAPAPSAPIVPPANTGPTEPRHRRRRPRVRVVLGVVAIVVGLSGLGATVLVARTLAATPPPPPVPPATAALGEAIRDTDGLTVRVYPLRTVPLAAPVPGRVGVAVRVTLTDAGTRALAVAGTRVRLAAGTAVPDARYDGRLAATLTPGQSDTAEYLFAVPASARPGAAVTVVPGGGRRTLVFVP